MKHRCWEKKCKSVKSHKESLTKRLAMRLELYHTLQPDEQERIHLFCVDRVEFYGSLLKVLNKTRGKQYAV